MLLETLFYHTYLANEWYRQNFDYEKFFRFHNKKKGIMNLKTVDVVKYQPDDDAFIFLLSIMILSCLLLHWVSAISRGGFHKKYLQKDFTSVRSWAIHLPCSINMSRYSESSHRMNKTELAGSSSLRHHNTTIPPGGWSDVKVYIVPTVQEAKVKDPKQGANIKASD